MRIWFVISIVCLVITGCTNTVEFNTPAFQAYNNGDLWKSQTQEATVIDTMFTVTGIMSGETIRLEVPNNSTDTIFDLGAGAASKAIYIDAEGKEYSTLFSAVDDPETEENESLIYISEGEILLDKTNTTPGTISGEFWFTAFDSLGVDKVNFNRGVFYEVPVN